MGSASVRVSHVTSIAVLTAAIPIVLYVPVVTCTAIGSIAMAALPDAASGDVIISIEHELIVIAGTLCTGII